MAPYHGPPQEPMPASVPCGARVAAASDGRPGGGAVYVAICMGVLVKAGRNAGSVSVAVRSAARASGQTGEIRTTRDSHTANLLFGGATAAARQRSKD
jgi:hypothetical protein